MIIWHVQCTLRQNLISSKRTVGYFHNIAILNLFSTEKQCYFILPQWPLMKNPILSHHLSCTVASLPRHFRMLPFFADILHCYKIQGFSCALRQPNLLGQFKSDANQNHSPSDISEDYSLSLPECYYYYLTRKKLVSFLLRTPTDQAQFYQRYLTKQCPKHRHISDSAFPKVL